MLTIGTNRHMRMVVGVAVVAAGVWIGAAAPETKPADSAVKGGRPAAGEAVSAAHAKESSDADEMDPRMLSLMRAQTGQIEIEVQFVAFDSTNVEKLVAAGTLDVKSLTRLWLNGGGHLLAAPRVLTKAGQEAMVKDVVEYIYPTKFAVSIEDRVGVDKTDVTGTNACTTVSEHSRLVRSPAVEPDGFQTREVGGILQVVPEVSSDGTMINLTLNPQLVGAPAWRDYGSKYLDSSGKEQQARMEQPLFPVISVSTSVSVLDGQRILIGGGLPSVDRKQVVYTFVSARIVAVNEVRK